jgi:hypothetical protein
MATAGGGTGERTEIRKVCAVLQRRTVDQVEARSGSRHSETLMVSLMTLGSVLLALWETLFGLRLQQEYIRWSRTAGSAKQHALRRRLAVDH